jgi:hypothetical protein
MGADEKQLAISLIRAFEGLLVQKSALSKLAEMHRIPSPVRHAFVTAMRNDPAIVDLTPARCQPLYDLAESAPDVPKVVESLLTDIEQRTHEFVW